jgi:hypothetical protein
LVANRDGGRKGGVNCDPRIEKGPELGFKASDQYQLTNSYSHIVSEKIICSKCKRSYFEKSKAYSLGFDRLENAIAGREVGGYM